MWHLCNLYLYSHCVTFKNKTEQNKTSPALPKIYLQNPLRFQKDKVVRTARKPLPCELPHALPWGLWHSFLHPLTDLFYPSPGHQLHPSKLEPLPSPTHLQGRPPQGKISPPSAPTSITLMNSKNQSLIDKNVFNQSMRHLEHRSSLSSSVSVFLRERKRQRFVAGQRGQVGCVKENGGKACWVLPSAYQSLILVCGSTKNLQQW